MYKEWWVRIRSGLVYVIFMLGITLHPISLALASAFLCAGCMYEYFTISGYSSKTSFTFAICGALMSPLLLYPEWLFIPFLGGLLIYLYLFLTSTNTLQSQFQVALGFIYILFPFVAFTAIPNHPAVIEQQVPSAILIFMMIVTWAHDSMAFTVGKLLGRHKLAPSISPGKTVEGSLGGLFFGIIAACICIGDMKASTIFWGLLVGLGALFGDLAESKFKRWKGVKDSGNILPGHGGFLDRLDAMLWTAPITYFWLG